AAKSPLAAAREQLRGEALPDVSLALAKPMRKADASPEECDAAFLLLEDAAQKGNGEAMLLVGEYYDPTATLPRGSIPVDMTQAKRWYDEALLKSDKAQAQAALNKLKEYARAEEAKGNVEARALLQSWN
ncbi:sel1 repeat family protein, partial [Desulfovibrio sp. 1214_IL3152]